jgi:ribosomal protein L34
LITGEKYNFSTVLTSETRGAGMATGVRPFRPRSRYRRLRVHGFMARMQSGAGRVLRLRRLKGRKRLVVA